MSKTLEELIKNDSLGDIEHTKLLLRETVQSIVLLGLSKGGFFEKASFYGGTALRIFYGLKRYSEDLDFTLNGPDENFDLGFYLEFIREAGLSYGITLDVEKKEKMTRTPVESAFAKLNTYTAFLSLKANSQITNKLHKDEVMKIKFEVDTMPALGFKTETKWLISPEFSPVTVLDASSLFAGKLHAILCRNYKNNVKGRDYYDFLFYVANHISPNMEYLRNKLINTGKIKSDDVFDMALLKKMLKDRFEVVDIDNAMTDASKFLVESEDLTKYTKELFIGLVNQLQ